MGRKADETSDKVLPSVTTGDSKSRRSVTYRDDQVNSERKSIDMSQI